MPSFHHLNHPLVRSIPGVSAGYWAPLLERLDALDCPLKPLVGSRYQPFIPAIRNLLKRSPHTHITSRGRIRNMLWSPEFR